MKGKGNEAALKYLGLPCDTPDYLAFACIITLIVAAASPVFIILKSVLFHSVQGFGTCIEPTLACGSACGCCMEQCLLLRCAAACMRLLPSHPLLPR